MPLSGNDLILGAIGVLQFDVVAFRLKDEYGVDCTYEPVTVAAARWVHCDDEKHLSEFRKKQRQTLLWMEVVSLPIWRQHESICPLLRSAGRTFYFVTRGKYNNHLC